MVAMRGYENWVLLHVRQFVFFGFTVNVDGEEMNELVNSRQLRANNHGETRRWAHTKIFPEFFKILKDKIDQLSKESAFGPAIVDNLPTNGLFEGR